MAPDERHRRLQRANGQRESMGSVLLGVDGADRWGRSYNLHIAAQLSLYALLSSGLTTAI